MAEKRDDRSDLYYGGEPALPPDEENTHDVFGNEAGHSIKYKTLSWPLVSMLMIAEIVSNGMLSLPSSSGVVGVHNMGDAGYILFGPIGREVLSAGTIIFAIFGTGSQLLAGQIALSVLSEYKLCLMLYTGIFAIPVLLSSFPRTLDRLSWLSVAAVASILVAGIVGMVGAGLNPVAGRTITLFNSTSTFYSGFVSVTNPVFAYAGHFMFFILISEMRDPHDAMKAAYLLQVFATSYYVIFAAVSYWYIGDGVASPSFLSLPTVWQKAAFGIAIPNFFIAGSLYSHTAAKLVFLRIFRHSEHLHSHTVIGWGTWAVLIVIMNGAAFVLAIGVPIFNYLVGLAASLFASWFTYGIAGAFWLYDAYHGFGDDGVAVGYRTGRGVSWQGSRRGSAYAGVQAWKRNMGHAIASFLTLVLGAFICVAGTYVTIRGIVKAYDNGSIGSPFSC